MTCSLDSDTCSADHLSMSYDDLRGSTVSILMFSTLFLMITQLIVKRANILGKFIQYFDYTEDSF
jgi:hypothetical protein